MKESLIFQKTKTLALYHFRTIGITIIKIPLSFSEVKSKTVVIRPTTGLFKYARPFGGNAVL